MKIISIESKQWLYFFVELREYLILLFVLTIEA